MKGIFKNNFIEDDNGIIKFNFKETVTKTITEFYIQNPFPQYDENDNLQTILHKGNRNYFARDLKKFIGFNKKILEVGSGTSQLSIYLAIGTNNKVYAYDATYKSLKMGKKFADKILLRNIKFINADIFEEIFHEEVFDFVICNGVLHHTSKPKAGFEIISKYLKKNGYVTIGLYNKIGRLRTHIRRILYKIFGNQIVRFMDPVLRNLKNLSTKQTNSWIKDQYDHPLESSHTFDELKSWFDKKNIEFINSIPAPVISINESNFFDKKDFGGFFERIFKQFIMIFSRSGSEGGLFIFIGKKK